MLENINPDLIIRRHQADQPMKDVFYEKNRNLSSGRRSSNITNSTSVKRRKAQSMVEYDCEDIPMFMRRRGSKRYTSGHKNVGSGSVYSHGLRGGSGRRKKHVGTKFSLK